MTYKTCERLAAHCRKMKDEAGARIYDERAAKKRKMFNAEKPAQEEAKK